MKRKRFLGLDSLVFIIKVYVYQYDWSTCILRKYSYSLFLIGCLFGRIPAFCSRILSAASRNGRTHCSHHSTTMTKRPSFCVAEHRLPVAMALNDALSYILFIFANTIVRRFGTNNTKHIIIMLAHALPTVHHVCRHARQVVYPNGYAITRCIRPRQWQFTTSAIASDLVDLTDADHSSQPADVSSIELKMTSARR